jgi:exodeoxyribonuclease V alpha subunit
MDLAQWHLLAGNYSLRGDLDDFLVERLSAGLPPAITPEARSAFAFGAMALCASLNRGDTFLPVDSGALAETLRNWFGDLSGMVRLDGARTSVAGHPVALAGETVAGWFMEQWSLFVKYLDEGVYAKVIASPSAPCLPMVYDAAAGRLYFQRFYEAVKGTNALIRNRMGAFPFVVADVPGIVLSCIRDTPPAMRPDARQTTALILALRNRTLILSGGPGTGKTTVVMQILRLFMRALPWLTVDDVRIAAPTGRAAVRLQEAIIAGLDAVLAATAAKEHDRACDKSLRALTGATVHRLLEYDPSTAGFLHNKENRLDAAVVVVDEVSMLDIELFNRLLDAIPENCALVLLGDRFQLPPVGAGAVLGDLAGGFPGGASLSPAIVGETTALLETAGQADASDLASAVLDREEFLRDRAVIFTRSHRSVQNLFRLASAINANDVPVETLRAHRVFMPPDWQRLLDSNAEGKNFAWVDVNASSGPVFPRLSGWIDYHFNNAYVALVNTASGGPADQLAAAAIPVLDALDTSRILCVLREGDRGAEGINAQAANACWRKLDPQGSPERFSGMPIIITRNAPRAGLYNGDCGALLHANDGNFYGCFRRGKTIFNLPLAALPQWQAAFAMTVHKAQGSEYERVLLVLPLRSNPVCTREIIYTALTRAKRFAAIMGAEDVLEESLKKTVRRNTGIEVGAITVN